MYKTLAIAAVISATLSTNVAAESKDNWVIGLDYLGVELKDDDADVNLNASALSLGYQFELSPRVSVTPTLSYGVGIGDKALPQYSPADSPFYIANTRIKLKRQMQIAAKVSYQLNEHLALSIAPSYTKLKVNVNGHLTCMAEVCAAVILPIDVTEEQGSFGATAGIDWRMNENLSVDLGYGLYDDANIMNAGIRYQF